ncbi:tetratricopeptide repeat protein [Flavobacterium ovatum]|uniref:tetratricopeptide repeat protein n=1 Tax=Flavobacterium ovatum TaxID=1928857 RepID=UPI003450B374
MRKPYFIRFLILTPLFLTAQSKFVKKSYHQNGLIAHEMWFDSNKQVDSIKTYHNVGGIKEAVYLDKQTKYHGNITLTNSEGKLKTTWVFDHGTLIKQTNHFSEYTTKTKQYVKGKEARLDSINIKLAKTPNNTSLIFSRAYLNTELENFILAEYDFLKIKNAFEKFKSTRTEMPPEKNIFINKTLANAYDHLAHIYANFGMANKAIKHHLLAIETYPQELRYTNNLGTYLYRTGQYRLAIHYYNEVLKKSPKHPFSNWGLGGTLLELEEYDKVIEHINTALLKEENLYKYERGITESDPRTIRGLAYHKTGQTELGITDLNEALKINDKNSIANKYLGVIYYDLGQKEKACGYFQKSRELNYEKKYYLKNLEQLIQKTCTPTTDQHTDKTLLVSNHKIEKNTVIEIISEVEASEFTSTTNSIKNPTSAPYISPNPAIDDFEVYNFDSSDFRFKIHNIESRLVREGMAIGKTITVTGLPTGLYLLTIEKGTSKQTFKLIKQ